MSKDQINELAKDIYSMLRVDAMSRALASMLYDKGWRKMTNDTEEKFFSPEDVRRMSPVEVRENHKAICDSMRKW